MSYYLFVTAVIAVIAIIYFWYATRGLHSIPDSTVLSLDTTENFLLDDWYNNNIKPQFDINLDDNEVASRLLNNIYGINVEPELILIGEDISSKYNRLFKRRIINNSNDASVDSVYDVRSAIGINLEIMVIHNKNVRDRLRCYAGSSAMPQINSVLQIKLDRVIYEYLQKILKYRWEKILSLNDDNVKNDSGTFLYLKKCDIPSITTANTPDGIRINLLCKDLEFETLIKRWTSTKQDIFSFPS